jgi:8-oxo-dGTP diphosphatase
MADLEINGDVAVVVAENKDRFLVVRRSEHESFSGKWEFPGGQVERGETVEDAAEREFIEETGLKPELLGSGEPYVGEGSTGYWRLHPFLVKVRSRDVELSREHDEYRWIKLRELDNMNTVGELKAVDLLGLK